MPEPHKGEKRKEWMDRCMGDSESVKDFPDASQRYRVCESKWDKRKQKKAEDMEPENAIADKPDNWELKVPHAARVLTCAPSALRLTEKNEGAVRRMRIEANSGEPIDHWFWGKFIMDMTGMRPRGEQLWALREHDIKKPVGVLTRVGIEETRKLVAEGYFVDTPDAKEVQKLHDEGCPFEASIYFDPMRIEQLEKGAEVEVNGLRFAGPGMVMREWQLNEASFCVFGADKHTKAMALNEEGETVEVNVTVIRGKREMTDEERAALALEHVKGLSVEQIAELRLDSVKSLCETWAADAVKAERERLAAYLNADPQDGLAAYLAGKTLEAVAAAVVEREKARLAAVEAENAKLKQEIEDAVRPAPHKATDLDGKGKAMASSEDEKDAQAQKWAEAFRASEELQAEYGGSEARYLAYMRADAAGLTNVRREE